MEIIDLLFFNEFDVVDIDPCGFYFFSKELFGAVMHLIVDNNNQTNKNMLYYQIEYKDSFIYYCNSFTYDQLGFF